MTETSPVALLCPRSTPLSKKNTVGVLFPNTEAKIVSLTNGEVLGPHQPGELFLRGPQVYFLYSYYILNVVGSYVFHILRF